MVGQRLPLRTTRLPKYCRLHGGLDTAQGVEGWDLVNGSQTTMQWEHWEKLTIDGKVRLKWKGEEWHRWQTDPGHQEKKLVRGGKENTGADIYWVPSENQVKIKHMYNVDRGKKRSGKRHVWDSRRVELSSKQLANMRLELWTRALHKGLNSEIIITVRGAVVHKGLSKVKSHKQIKQKRHREKQEKHERVVAEDKRASGNTGIGES